MPVGTEQRRDLRARIGRSASGREAAPSPSPSPLGHVDPNKTGRSRRSAAMSGKVRKIARRVSSSVVAPIVSGGSSSRKNGRRRRSAAAALNRRGSDSDSKKYGLSDPFNEKENRQRQRGGRVIVRSTSGTELFALAENNTSEPLGGGKLTAEEAAHDTSFDTAMTAGTASVSTGPSFISSSEDDRSDGCASSFPSSVTISAADSERLSPIVGNGGENAGEQKKSPPSVAEVKLVEFLQAETEALRQLEQQQQQQSPGSNDDDQADDLDDARSVTSYRSFASADSRKLYEETTRAVKEAEETARKMKELMEWMEKQQQLQQQQQEKTGEHEEKEEAKAERQSRYKEVLDDRMVPLEELERLKKQTSRSRSRSSRCAPSTIQSQSQTASSDERRTTATNKDDIHPEKSPRCAVRLHNNTSGAPDSGGVSRSVAEYRKKRRAARQNTLVQVARAAATGMAAVGTTAGIFFVKGGRLSLLSLPRPQLGWSTASSLASAASSRSEGIDASTASNLIACSRQLKSQYLMGTMYNAGVPPHEAALADRGNRNLGKVPFLGMSIGDGYA